MPSQEEKRFWMGMARIVSHVSKRADKELGTRHGISLSEMTMMGQVRALDGSARMVDLADRLQVTKTAVTKLTDSLEGHQYVRRVRDPSDRRVYLLQLTDEGRACLRRAEVTFEGVVDELLWSHLSTDETVETVQLLSRILDSLDLPSGGIMPPS